MTVIYPMDSVIHLNLNNWSLLVGRVVREGTISMQRWQVQKKKSLTVATSELVTKTSLIVICTEMFITAVSTVIFTITAPVHGDTIPWSTTKATSAAGSIAHSFTFIPLVRTIIISITQPLGVNTLVTVSALCFPWRACHRGAVVFIRKIPTVIIAVTLPLDVDTVAISASESVCRTCLWRKWETG